MTEFRIWHASRDPYHCIFRMLSLLLVRKEPVGLERLRILDMYFLYPPLLHRLSLPEEEKKKFRALEVSKPQESFIRLPSTASVWQNLQVFQSAALKQMAGKKLLKLEALELHSAELDVSLVPSHLAKRVEAISTPEIKLINFLVKDITGIPTSGQAGLIQRAKLPSRGPIR